jgi:hypothetical protein
MLEAADYLLFRDESLCSRITRRVERHRGEGPSLASHVGVMATAYDICHAQPEGVVIQPLSEYLAKCNRVKGFEWAAYRRHGLSSCQHACIGAWLASHVGARYSKSELLLCGLDWIPSLLLGHNVICARYLGDMLPTRVICSKLAGELADAYDLLPGENAYGTPDCLCDLIETEIVRHQTWTRTYETAGWCTPVRRCQVTNPTVSLS